MTCLYTAMIRCNKCGAESPETLRSTKPSGISTILRKTLAVKYGWQRFVKEQRLTDWCMACAAVEIERRIK
jgi:hypothetical protein